MNAHRLNGLMTWHYKSFLRFIGEGIEMTEIGKMLLFLGGVLIVLGIVVILLSKFPFVGRLPGDLLIQSENLSCFFPIVTSLLISLVATIVLNILYRILNK
jgi:hypothetical protein